MLPLFPLIVNPFKDMFYSTVQKVIFDNADTSTLMLCVSVYGSLCN